MVYKMAYNAFPSGIALAGKLRYMRFGEPTLLRGRGMINSYFFFYTEATVVCVLILGIMLVHDYIKASRQEKQVRLDYTLIALILYFISDNFWCAIISGHIPRTRPNVALFNYSNLILLAAITYHWFMYTAAAEDMQLRRTTVGRWLIRAPIIVSTLLMAVMYAFHPDYWVSPDGELNIVYYVMLVAAPLVYLTASAIYSLRRAKREKDPANSRLFRMIALVPLVLAITGIVQILALNAPLFCFGSALLMLFFYIESMDGQISIDPLTKLNNRSQLFRYISQGNYRVEGRKTYVVMIDVNDFKMINDTYGHAEGDHALVMVAEALKGAAEATRIATFLGRFGGDEFTMVVHAERPEAVDSLAYLIRLKLNEKTQAAGAPYRLSLGIGYDELRPVDDNFQDCMKRADEKLYLDKEREKKKLAHQNQ